MKTAIIFKSSKGFVTEVAQRIQTGLGSQAEIFDLSKRKKIDISKYNNLVIAGSVMAGRFNSKIRKFINKNSDNFQQKKVYLVSAGLDEKGYKDMLMNNFSEQDLSRINETVYAGGRFLPEQHPGIVRKLMAKINKAEGAVHNEKWGNIDSLITAISKSKK